MKKLWQKKTSQMNKEVEIYTSGEDIFLDQQLVPFDIYGSAAHVRMLQKIGLINAKELTQILKALKKIMEMYKAGTYQLQFGDEDVHTRIEQDVSAKLPEAGEKIHTGRSRNDQVLVDLRLFTKDRIQKVAQKTLHLAQHFLVLAEKYKSLPMPGYTHMQQAMLSSVGLWLEQFTESFMDDLACLDAAYILNDQSPLGSGAGYGVSLPLDRKMTAQLLGFEKVQTNSLYCQNSRGKIEGLALHSLAQLMLTCGRFAQDMLLFTTEEFRFFSLPAELTTGSSIMPQKRNLDIMELVRARAKLVVSYENQVLSLVTGLPSGYNRDLQEIKKPYFAAFEVVSQTLDILDLTLSKLIVHEEKLSAVITPELFAAHHGYQIMQKENMPFRKAYQFVGEHLDQIPHYDPKEVLAATNHVGAAGNLAFTQVQKNLQTHQQLWTNRQKKLSKILGKLLA